MTKVGIAGIGFMGWIHWLAYQELPDVEVVAIATPEAERRAGDWTGIQGNFGPPGTQIDLTGVKTYENLQAMLADSDLEVDCVDICLPPAMHCDAIQAAAKAGKHVSDVEGLCIWGNHSATQYPDIHRASVAGEQAMTMVDMEWYTGIGSIGNFKSF